MVAICLVGLLVAPATATAQEDDLSQYAGLDQLGHVIDAFVAGDEIEGVILDAADEASDAIVRQFQITTNLVSGPTRGVEGIEFVPVGFAAGSGTELENLEEHFDGTIGESGIIPPLAPWSRVDDEIDLSAQFDGWTVVGDRGPIEGPLGVLPNVKAIWGVELTYPIEETCQETRYVGRTWVSEGFGGPDPLFTAEALLDNYGRSAQPESHVPLAGLGGRTIQFACSSQGFIAWAERMKDDGDVRPFGPTGVIALVKDQFVIFLIQARELDGRLEQVFFASPPDGGPVAVSAVESEDLLLVPNPYEEFPTRISILIDGDEEAISEQGARHLFNVGASPNAIRIQTTGGCRPRDTEIFTRDDFLEAAASSGFARDSMATAILKTTPGQFEYTLIDKNGNEESGTVDLATGVVDWQSGTCPGTGLVNINGEPLGAGAEPPATEDGSGGSDDGSKTEASGSDSSPEEGGSDTSAEEGGGIPWGPIGLAIVLLAAATAYGVNRQRNKKDCKPEEEALDAATRAASSAHKAAAERETAVGDAIASDAPKNVIAQARAEADQAHAAAEVAMDTYRQARAAYQACKGAADTGDEPGVSGLGAGAAETTRERSKPEPGPKPESGGTPLGPESPGVLTDPEEIDSEEKCREGNEKVLPDSSMPAQTFTVPIGNVVVDFRGMRSWTNAMGGDEGLTQEAFAALSESELEDALADFDDYSKKVRIHPKIPIAVYTVQCGYMHRCTNGEWVKTDEIGTYKVTRTMDTLAIGDRRDSPSKETAIKHVQEAQAKLKELQAEQEAYDNFECG